MAVSGGRVPRPWVGGRGTPLFDPELAPPTVRLLCGSADAPEVEAKLPPVAAPAVVPPPVLWAAPPVVPPPVVPGVVLLPDAEGVVIPELVEPVEDGWLDEVPGLVVLPP